VATGASGASSLVTWSMTHAMMSRWKRSTISEIDAGD
jgi:hypothetical protein